MLPWLMEVGEVAVDEVARRYDLTPAQVQSDLELVAMCGLPPFVDEMIDVFVDDGIVYVGVPRLFTRPLRLTAPEGFTLLTAARAAMELPGADPAGPLGRGLAKLAAALNDVGIDTGSDDTAGFVVDLHRPPLTDELTEAAATGAELAIRYYSPGRDEQTARRIVPRHVFTDAGNWYVVADDGRTSSRRTFRIDRIESAAATGVTVDLVDDVTRPTGFFVDEEVDRTTLRLGPSAQWILEEYPYDRAEAIAGRPGWTTVVLPVSSPRWLARLLIRLGPDAEVADPAAAQPAAELAQRMLAQYRSSGRAGG